MFRRLFALGERYLYRPNFALKALAILLLPFSFLYFVGVILKFKFSKQIDFGLPIFSIGNLTLGGSGKTPLGIAILNEFDGGFVILRGYKRSSKGMVVVARNGEILTDVKISGDEAMEYAKSVKNANVIVSENRDIAIKEAKRFGAKFIVLDDGFSKFHIKKFNILIRPTNPPFFNFTLPSGGYRYPLSFYKFADFIAICDIDFSITTHIQNPTSKMVLVTAIANPHRLENFKQKCIASEFFPDHYDFYKAQLEEILAKYGATSLLVTMKDFVKISDFGLPISLICLKNTLSDDFVAILKQNLLK